LNAVAHKYRWHGRIAVLVMLALWQAAPYFGDQVGLFIAPPSEVLAAIWKMLLDGELIRHVKASILRALIGFILAAFVGIPAGVLLGGWFPRVERVVHPVLNLLGQVNPFSMFPVFMLIFGIGEGCKVVMIFWVCVWPILFHTMTGILSIDPSYIRMSLSMRISFLSLLRKVIVPGAIPMIFSGLKAGAGTAFFMLIAAEMVGASSGLGWLVWNAQINYQISKLFAATIAITMIGMALSGVFTLIEKRLLFWNATAEED